MLLLKCGNCIFIQGERGHFKRDQSWLVHCCFVICLSFTHGLQWNGIIGMLKKTGTLSGVYYPTSNNNYQSSIASYFHIVATFVKHVSYSYKINLQRIESWNKKLPSDQTLSHSKKRNRLANPTAHRQWRDLQDGSYPACSLQEEWIYAYISLKVH